MVVHPGSYEPRFFKLCKSINMKKIIFFVSLATILSVSCSKDKDTLPVGPRRTPPPPRMMPAMTIKSGALQFGLSAGSPPKPTKPAKGS